MFGGFFYAMFELRADRLRLLSCFTGDSHRHHCCWDAGFVRCLSPSILRFDNQSTGGNRHWIELLINALGFGDFTCQSAPALQRHLFGAVGGFDTCGVQVVFDLRFDAF